MKKRQLLSSLEIQKDLGADWAFTENRNSTLGVVDKKANVTKTSVKKNLEIQNSNNNLNKATTEWVALAKSLAEKASSIEELKEIVTNFDGLSIKKNATNCVFSEGNTKAKIMLIGEAPGENEDLEARPFCGVSGKLLDKIFEAAGFSRNGTSAENSFYITNSIFWRPPGNRKPTNEEIEICKPFVEKHIALIKPKVIVLIGATATVSVLDNKESISTIRGKKHNYINKYLENEIACFAIYHPSFLLRQPSQKKNAWFDVLKIKKFFNSI